MQKINEFQKRIYNTYLKCSRYGKPYKYRTSFDDISEYILINLEKLSLFFNKHPHLDLNDFFESPLVIYPDQPYPKLDYFLSRSSVRAYSLYKKQKEEQNPELQSESIKESLLFIMKFCLQNKIYIENYLKYRNGVTYVWLDHYRQRKINIYSLMEMGDIISIIDDQPKDILDLFSENLKDRIATFKIRYKQSQKTIELVRKGTERIKNFIKKELQFAK